MTPFLTAYWKNLLNVTYKVDPALLLPHVPPGVELDVQDGKAFASVVAFEFLDTRVKGLKIPFHVNFPEINLRYYLKHDGKRGVAFIKELVPRFCIAFIADKVYNEPYESCPMRCDTSETEDKLKILHQFTYKGKLQEMKIEAKNRLSMPSEDSVEHYFKEHDIGFGKTKSGEPLFYEVKHPKWEIYELESYQLDVDFGLVYGEEWAFLKEAEPHSALLAKGSEIAVYPKNVG